MVLLSSGIIAVIMGACGKREAGLRGCGWMEFWMDGCAVEITAGLIDFRDGSGWETVPSLFLPTTPRPCVDEVWCARVQMTSRF